MNRALRNQHAKRCAFRKYGGGYGMGAPLVAPMDGSFSVTVPVNQSFDDCAFPARSGQLFPIADTGLAQVAMAGGNCGCSALKRGGTRRAQRGGGCGYTVFKRGGSRTRRAQRGAGFAVDVAMPIGGNGPVAVPGYIALPCNTRTGTEFGSDPRAPATLYSLTANQAAQMGGGVSGAPGSQIPVYNANVAGFYFNPSTGAQVGTVPFNEVVPQAARVGGKRKSRKQRSRKQRSRKH